MTFYILRIILLILILAVIYIFFHAVAECSTKKSAIIGAVFSIVITTAVSMFPPETFVQGRLRRSSMATTLALSFIPTVKGRLKTVYFSNRVLTTNCHCTFRAAEWHMFLPKTDSLIHTKSVVRATTMFKARCQPRQREILAFLMETGTTLTLMLFA